MAVELVLIGFNFAHLEQIQERSSGMEVDVTKIKTAIQVFLFHLYVFQ